MIKNDIPITYILSNIALKQLTHENWGLLICSCFWSDSLWYSPYRIWRWGRGYPPRTCSSRRFDLKYFLLDQHNQYHFKPTFNCSVLLLDLHDPGRSWLSNGLERDGGFVQPPLPLGLLVSGGVLAASPPLEVTMLQPRSHTAPPSSLPEAQQKAWLPRKNPRDSPFRQRRSEELGVVDTSCDMYSLLWGTCTELSNQFKIELLPNNSHSLMSVYSQIRWPLATVVSWNKNMNGKIHSWIEKNKLNWSINYVSKFRKCKMFCNESQKSLLRKVERSKGVIE